MSRFTFPKGQSNILLNLGLGLTNEEGAMVKVVSSTEIEGMRSVGSFCYNSPEDAYPVYFVAQFSKPADKFGVWKKPAKYNGVEAQWMGYNGKARIMENTIKTVVGDSIGSYFTYKFDKQETVEVKIGISYVSIENARENLAKKWVIDLLTQFTKKPITNGTKNCLKFWLKVVQKTTIRFLYGFVSYFNSPKYFK